MKRIIVDYAKLTNEILNLLVEKFPDGYDDSNIIRFRNAKNELIEAVEVRTEDTIYLVKVSTKLADRIENFDEEEDFITPEVSIDAIKDLGDGRIHPHYGVFAPVRSEYIGLLEKAPFPASINKQSLAFDIGTGTGVLAAVLAKRGIQKIVATDQDERAIECATENIEGLGIGKQVKLMQTNLFPHMVQQMIAIGEESGSMDAMLAKIADFYEEEVDEAVANLSALMEPMIMAVLGVLVGGLIIAMYLPIFQLGQVV